VYYVAPIIPRLWMWLCGRKLKATVRQLRKILMKETERTWLHIEKLSTPRVRKSLKLGKRSLSSAAMLVQEAHLMYVTRESAFD
jgi:hypothetical protein